MTTDVTPYRISVHRGGAVAADPVTSIIILVTADTTMLQRCLRSVAATAFSERPSEVIVVANGTPRGEVAALAARGDIVLVRSPVNHGFGGGCNLAVRAARGERLVFLNDDVAVTRGWLEGLHSALDADPFVGVAGSRVVLSDGRLQEAGCVLWRDGSTSGAGRGRAPDDPAFSQSRPVDYVSFCSAMVRRSAWNETGGFDERYFPAYYEDVDLCLTLHRLGWRVTYESTSVVHHDEGASASPEYRSFLSRRNQAAFVAKWGTALDDYDAPPASEGDRAPAVERALRRAAQRRVLLPTAPAAVPNVEPLVTTVDDVDGLVLEVAALSAAVTVDAEYIRFLRERASAMGILDALKLRVRRRLAPRIKGLLNRRLAGSGHPR